MHDEWGERKLKYKKTAEQKSASDAGRMAQRAYLREWRANNPEKVRQYNRAYWERKAEREGQGA